MVSNSFQRMANVDNNARWLHSDAELLSGQGVCYNATVSTRILFCFYLIQSLFLVYWIG